MLYALARKSGNNTLAHVLVSEKGWLGLCVHASLALLTLWGVGVNPEASREVLFIGRVSGT